MRILYGYSNCTDKKYNEIAAERNVFAMRPDQKYHGLLIKGLAENGARPRCFSGLPVNRAVTSRKLVREPDETEDGVLYHYITTVNFPVIRQLMIFFGAFFGILGCKKDSETFAICDALNNAIAMAFLAACKIKRIPLLGIVTDIPDMFDQSGWRKKLGNLIMSKFGGYVFLTEAMNGAVNKKGRPYIVLEGHVDSRAAQNNSEQLIEKVSGEKAVLYAGDISRLYGIKNLVEGFMLADIPDAGLYVYGEGDYREELEQIAQSHNNVKYMGARTNQEVVETEQKAALLVNPRPSGFEYTKYSFPSKNMEYMVSGTPVLTTRLPGMPKEYFPYVYFIEDETPQGIADALKSVLRLPADERIEKGRLAREFVLKEKTNVRQAGKILEFIRNEL